MKYQGHCEHCGFYGHELKNCYGEKKGLPAATPEEKYRENYIARYVGNQGSMTQKIIRMKNLQGWLEFKKRQHY